MYPFPEHTEIKKENDSVTASFRIPESYPFFNGHFPGNPLVPAVVQVGWAIASFRMLIPQASADYRLSRFKFIAPIRPGKEVDMEVLAFGNTFKCRIRANGELCSSGTLVLESHV